MKCKPMVKQYLLNRYGTNQDGTIKLPKYDWVRHLIVSQLQRNENRRDTEVNIQYFKDEVNIPISNYDFFQYGAELTKTAILTINNRIEDIIRQSLYQFLEFYVHVAGYQLKDAIEMYQQIYNMPEEVLSRDAVTKHYQRNIKPNVVLQKFMGIEIKRTANYRAQK